MPRTSSLYPLHQELAPRLPSLPERLRWGLALWLKGTLLAHNGCQDSVAMALEGHGRFETVRRELREWTCDDADRIRAWGPDQEVDVEACFPELLRWVRDLWTPDRDAPAAEPPGTPVHVLCDQGLGSRRLWTRIGELVWHPVLRYPLHITFRPTGSDRVPARQLGGGPGTLVALHAQGHKEPWLLLTDTVPDRTDVDLYACRHWIEQGFRGCKRGGWQWQRTRRRSPVRVARHRLVLAVATLLAVAYGTRHEDARDRGLPPGRLRRPPAEGRPPDAAPRRFSLLRQGAACLVKGICTKHRIIKRLVLNRQDPDSASVPCLGAC
ncbi:MAG: transposase [Caldilineaceae bacterium SB0662_bin_9]|uniref:Transposase n=1 Tax=Caldilineaceae bacterium SB0662_bin_9 TaxID=2605258 RepID=A0A6B1DYT0_9CHLR|nr:transposase [Caldilineaceae bacterium SB0662_bin_9]